ncbi:hypothetical protein H5407_19870 [Mitsuaria sp. WAJ17]|uniref:hypothetical protein n=1 Tax=Mitsuaria sp. WAJ17 TaxID=2761452 RepID=UPI001600E50B|nr:hypothetical protein [Mitsuaria sp. WAJ17]MBB2487498.1 hypothetical protein [Mitsuaria sp. WAJ17]
MFARNEDSEMNTANSKVIRGGRRIFGRYTLKGVECAGCSFVGGTFGYNGNWEKDSQDSLCDALIMDAEINGCSVGPAIIRRSTFSGIRGDLLICWGTFFDQVKVFGRFDALMLNGVPKPGLNEADKRIFSKKRSNFYRDVEWALDISQAEFSDFCIRYSAVPIEKIILDPATQFVVDISGGVGGVDGLVLSSYTKTMISQMLKERAEKGLLVAPKRDGKLFSAILQDADILRSAGYIKPA